MLTMAEVTLLCVCVLAPEGTACCKKTAVEIVSVESGASAYSRHTPLPTGPLSLLHKLILMLKWLNDLKNVF